MKRSLRTRFAVAFAFATVIPIAAAAFTAGEIVRRRSLGEYEETLKRAKQDAERELSLMGADLIKTASGFGTTDWPLEIAYDLRHSEGKLNEDRQRDIRNQAPTQMRALGLDLLTLIDSRGTVLASGHFPGDVGSKVSPIPISESRGKQAFILEERSIDPSGAAPKQLFLAAVSPVAREGFDIDPVQVVVGKKLDQLISRLHRQGKVDVHIETKEGIRLTGSKESKREGAHSPTLKLPLRDAQGKIAAELIVTVPDAALRHTLRQLTIAASLLATLAVALSIALGVWVARRITRGLDSLVSATEAVARGELDHRVAVSGNDELAQLGNTFNRMTEDLSDARTRLLQAERLAAWQEIARRIAHEIKNPLTPIQMSMETLQRCYKSRHPKLDEIVAESTQTVLEECNRLKRIVTEFSQFARMPKPEPRTLDLSTVVGHAISLYSGAVPVVSELEPDANISGDSDQLTQVVLNLVENARHAVLLRPDGGAAGEIRVKTWRARNAIMLEVADNGPGFDEKARSQLFTPYFTTKQGGTGLGLAIVHRIVTDHGGRISAEKSENGGAIFRVAIPADAGVK